MFRRRALRRRLAAGGAPSVPDDQLRKLARALDAGPAAEPCVPGDSALALAVIRTFRHPDVRDLAELRRLPHCSLHQCCNPYHYSRLCEPGTRNKWCVMWMAGEWMWFGIESSKDEPFISNRMLNVNPRCSISAKRYQFIATVCVLRWYGVGSPHFIFSNHPPIVNITINRHWHQHLRVCGKVTDFVLSWSKYQLCSFDKHSRDV